MLFANYLNILPEHLLTIFMQAVIFAQNHPMSTA